MSRDQRLDRRRVEIERVRAAIGKYRARAHPRHAAAGRKKGECGADHLVARTEAQGHQRDQEGVGSGGHAHAEADAGNLRRVIFEILDLRPQDELAGREDAREGVAKLAGDRRILALHV